ncbi:TPA: plasmid mobilization relaxosome protein MobC [Streptococcus suis]
MATRRNEKTKKYENRKASKENRINVRVSDELLELVDEFANEYAVSRSEVTRLALSGELKQMRPKMDISVVQFDELLNVLKDVDDAFSKYDRHLRSISNNVNQIAKKMNRGGVLSDEDRLLFNHLLKNVKAIRRMLESVSTRLWDEV